MIHQPFDEGEPPPRPSPPTATSSKRQTTNKKQFTSCIQQTRNRKSKQQTTNNDQQAKTDKTQSTNKKHQSHTTINHNHQSTTTRLTKIKKSREKTCYCQALRISDTVFVIFRWSIHLLYGPLSEAVERLHYLQRCEWMVRAVRSAKVGTVGLESQHQTPLL